MATGFGTSQGGLNSLNSNQQSSLTDALTENNKGFSLSDTISNNLGGFGRSVLGYAVPALEPALNVYSAVSNLGNLANNYNTNSLANNLTNTNTNWGGFSGKGMNTLANEIDQGYYGGIGTGGVNDVNSNLSPFGPGVNSTADGNVTTSEVMDAMGTNYGQVNDVVSTYSPFGPGINSNISKDPLTPYAGDPNTDNTVGSKGDLGGAKGAGYKGSVGGIFGIGKADGVDTSDPNSTGNGPGGVSGMGDESGAGTGSSSSSATAGQDTATSGPTGTSYSSDEQGSGSGGGGGTHCCTASMIRGEITLTEVKKLRVWHRKQSKVWQEGYDVWGKIIADLLISKYDWCANRAKEFYDYKIHNKITSGAILSSIVIYTGSYICGSYKVLKEKINAIKEVHTERPLR